MLTAGRQGSDHRSPLLVLGGGARVRGALAGPGGEKDRRWAAPCRAQRAVALGAVETEGSEGGTRAREAHPCWSQSERKAAL